MRILFFRIFPETAASTTCCVLSSCTLKNALGCLSMMVPSAGIKSSLANRCSFSFEFQVPSFKSGILSVASQFQPSSPKNELETWNLKLETYLPACASWSERSGEDRARSGRTHERLTGRFTLSSTKCRQHNSHYRLSGQSLNRPH